MKLWRWAKRGLLGLAAVFVLLVFGVFPYWMAGRITGGRFKFNDRENAGLTPASFKLAFEDVAFRSPDGIPLKGWWVPSEPARGTVVLVHGLNRSRIEMVRKVPFLHARGWNALVLAAVILGALMLALQLWLLTTALDLYLAGEGEDVWQLAVASAVLFAGGVLALLKTSSRRRASGTEEHRQ